MNKNGTIDSQAGAFVRSMYETGWTALTSWSDGGHIFELLSKGSKSILVQTYPQGHGFQVWKPIVPAGPDFEKLPDYIDVRIMTEEQWASNTRVLIAQEEIQKGDMVTGDGRKYRAPETKE